VGLVELLESKRAWNNKWVYRLKEENDDTKRYKTRLVAKEFQQREGIDFNEDFSVVKLTIIKSMLSIFTSETVRC